MRDTLAFLAPGLAVAVSVLAVARGIDELTSGARLRNLEGVLRAAQAPPIENADPVLSSIHRLTVGRIVAREAVPTNAFALPIVGLLLQVAIGAREAHNMKPEVLAAVWWVTLAVFGVVALLSEVCIRALGRLLRERARVTRAIVRGAASVKACASALGVWTPQSSRHEWQFSSRAGLGVALGAAGIGIALRGDQTPALAGASLGLTLAGGLLLTYGFVRLRSYVDDEAEPGAGPVTWEHPSTNEPG